MRTRIELCGQLRIEVDGHSVEDRLPGRQLRLLFARLALAAGGGVPREELLRTLWPDVRPQDAPAVLRTLLSRLRAVLGTAAVAGRTEVRIALPDPVVIDVVDAERAVAAARTALDDSDFLAAFDHAQAALAVLGREFLPGESGEWVRQQRRRLDEGRLEALECETLAGSYLGGAARARALRAGRELVERAPFRESGYAALMQAHVACGNVAEAIRLYVTLRDLLRDELATTPSETTVQLYEHLLSGQSAGAAQPVSYEGSPELLRRTLTAIEGAAPADASLRCELLLQLAASLDRTGAVDRARETFAEAAQCARDLGRGDLLGYAALGYGGHGIPFAPGSTDPVLAELLEEALGALGESQTPLKPRLLARMATVLWEPAHMQRRAALAEEAVKLARVLGDPPTLALALSARHLAAWAPDNLDQRLADAVELVGLSQMGADVESTLPGHLWLFTDRLESGDLDAADRELATYARLASELGHPGYLWWEALLRAMRHFMAGRFEDAERYAERVMALAPRTQDEIVAQLIAIQVLAIRKEGGELGLLEETVRETSQRYPQIAGWRCLLAYLYAEIGRPSEARAEFDPLIGQLDSLPRDHLWLISVALLADTCAVLGDRSAAALLYDDLAPYSGRVVVGLGGLWFGPVDHHLGLLARTARDFDAAERYFAQAVATNRSMGALPWLGHTQRERAAVLSMPRGPRDYQRGHTLLDEAAAIAEQLGMTDLDRAVARVRAALEDRRRPRAPAGRR